MKKYLTLYLGLLLLGACQSNNNATTSTNSPYEILDTNEHTIVEVLPDSCLIEQLADSIPESKLVAENKTVTKKSKVGKKKKKKVKEKPKPPPPMRTEIFKGELELFLAALKQGDIDAAAKYSTDAGLRSFLSTDYDAIYNYSVFECEADDYIGTAYVSFNNDSPIKLYFNRKGGKGNYLFLGPKKWD